MTAIPASQPHLTIGLVKDAFTLQLAGQTLQLSPKWVVFYTLLAVNNDRHISTDEVCDHHPWSRLTPDIAGRDLWRFTRQQEERHFGQRISSSPARQATKLFTLHPSMLAALSFQPDQATVADHLRSLRQHRNAVAMQLGECTLLLQSGLTAESLRRLTELRETNLSINDRAHAETLITMSLDEQSGTAATAVQMPILEQLLTRPGLNRLNRARLLIRLARYATLNAQYPQARAHFQSLRSLLLPEDGVEFCWYHTNYGLYLRRTGQLDQAIYHQRLAHDTAQLAQWWYGVHAARYNLALMHHSASEQGPPANRKRHLYQALDWAMKAYSTAVLTRQAISVADTAMLISSLESQLGHTENARHWLRHAPYLAPEHPDHYPSVSSIYSELAQIEQRGGNHFLASLARQKAQAALRGEPIPLPGSE